MTLVIAGALFAGCTQQENKNEQFEVTYPETKKTDQIDEYFGIKVADPYRWLEDDRSAETEAWVKAQNEATFGYLEKIPYRTALKDKLTNLADYEKYGSPFKKNGKYYFFKNDGLQNQSVMYEQATLESEPKVFLDPNTLSEDGTVALGGFLFRIMENILPILSQEAVRTGEKFMLETLPQANCWKTILNGRNSREQHGKAMVFIIVRTMLLKKEKNFRE